MILIFNNNVTDGRNPRGPLMCDLSLTLPDFRSDQSLEEYTNTHLGNPIIHQLQMLS